MDVKNRGEKTAEEKITEEKKDPMDVFDELIAGRAYPEPFGPRTHAEWKIRRDEWLEQEIERLRKKALEHGWKQSRNQDVVYVWNAEVEKNLFVNIRECRYWHLEPTR